MLPKVRVSIIKVPLAVAAIVQFAVVALSGAALFRNPRKRRQFQVANVSFHARLFLKWMNVRVDGPAVSPPGERLRPGSLIVSNHVSYLDAMIVVARYPAVLVTSVEVRDTPFLGHIARLCGCVFVERRNRAGLNEEIDEISRILGKGFNVAFFPEGTSTDGSRVLPFKRSLFRSALGIGAQVRPLTLNYRTVDGRAISAENRDKVFYYGDLQFGPQFMDFLSTRCVSVQMQAGEPFVGQTDHRALAERAFQAVTNGFVPVPF